MKRNLILLAAFIAVIGLIAEPHDNSEYTYYQAYQEDATPENFVKAYNYYQKQNDEIGKLLQAYLHFSELDNLLKEMNDDLDSLSTKTQFNYANLLLELGRYEESITVYNKLNASLPAWGCPWRHKGEAYWKLEDLEQAEIALKKSIEVRENHYDAYVMLAEVQRDAGRYTEALETLEKGLEYKAENPEYSEDTEFEQNVSKLHEELKAKLKKIDAQRTAEKSVDVNN